jgi:hypothetical protein
MIPTDHDRKVATSVCERTSRGNISSARIFPVQTIPCPLEKKKTNSTLEKNRNWNFAALRHTNVNKSSEEKAHMCLMDFERVI